MSRYNDDFTNDDLVGDICPDDDSDILLCLADVWDVSELEYEPVTAEDLGFVTVFTWDYSNHPKKLRYFRSEARRRGFIPPRLAKRMHKRKVKI